MRTCIIIDDNANDFGEGKVGFQLLMKDNIKDVFCGTDFSHLTDSGDVFVLERTNTLKVLISGI